MSRANSADCSSLADIGDRLASGTPSELELVALAIEAYRRTSDPA